MSGATATLIFAAGVILTVAAALAVWAWFTLRAVRGGGWSTRTKWAFWGTFAASQVAQAMTWWFS